MSKGLKKTEYVRIAVAVVTVLLILGGWVAWYTYGTFLKPVRECEILVPMESPMVTGDEWGLMNTEIPKLGFAAKERICYGKYGFRKKFEISKRTNLSQEIIEDFGLNKIRYGVYRDESLDDPIKEVDMDKVLEASQKAELEYTELKDIPYFGDKVDVTLEPGTYYIGVYSIDRNEQHTVSYESWQAVVESEIELEEGKWGFFLSTGDKNKTYCKMELAKGGKIYVEDERKNIPYEIKLCDVNKKIIAGPVLDPQGKKRHKKAIFDIPEEGIYYLQVISDNPKPSVVPNEIRYKVL